MITPRATCNRTVVANSTWDFVVGMKDTNLGLTRTFLRPPIDERRMTNQGTVTDNYHI